MAYDAELAARIRETLAREHEVTERAMFGGLAFLIRGHMTVVASGKGGLMIRTDPDATAELVETTSAECAEMRGRQMLGWLRIDAAHIRSDTNLANWIQHAVSYSSTLPPKT